MDRQSRQSTLGRGVPDGASSEFVATALLIDLCQLFDAVKPTINDRVVNVLLARAIEGAIASVSINVAVPLRVNLLHLRRAVARLSPLAARWSSDQVMRAVIAGLLSAIGEHMTRRAVVASWGRSEPTRSGVYQAVRALSAGLGDLL